ERLNAGFPAMNFSLKRAREQFNTAYSIPNQDFSAMARLARVAKFRDLVKAFSFNESNQKPRTFPSVFPWLRLDRMYQRGFEVETAEVLKGRPWSKISDHSPILA